MGFFFIVLLINTAYIAAFATPSVFYMGNVVFHLGLGLAMIIGLVFLVRKQGDLVTGMPVALGLFGVSAALALVLVKMGDLTPGNITDARWAFWGHIGAAALGLAAMIPYVRRKASENGGGWLRFQKAFQVALAILVLFPASTALYNKAFPNPKNRIRNPMVVPTAMH